jgi:hypothetical protein
MRASVYSISVASTCETTAIATNHLLERDGPQLKQHSHGNGPSSDANTIGSPSHAPELLQEVGSEFLLTLLPHRLLFNVMTRTTQPLSFNKVAVSFISCLHRIPCCLIACLRASFWAPTIHLCFRGITLLEASNCVRCTIADICGTHLLRNRPTDCCQHHL